MRQINRALQQYFNDHGEFPCEDPGDCDHNSSRANRRLGEGSPIDTLLAPYMNGQVPHDPSGPGHNEYYYYYDGWHCNSKGSAGIAVIAVHELETADYVRRDTTCGGEADIDNADYVIKVGESSG